MIYRMTVIASHSRPRRQVAGSGWDQWRGKKPEGTAPGYVADFDWKRRCTNAYFLVLKKK
jgi:hypothetical protein